MSESRGDFQNLKMKIDMPGREEVKNDLQPKRKRPLTQATIEQWIRMQPHDEWMKTELIKIANTYPDTALPAFEKNFNKLIARVQQKRNK